ncbi:MAG: hypothetical protein AAF648_08580 [Pseudomonadota bacterium]
MKWVKRGAVLLVVALISLFGVEQFAAESGEVVVLETIDDTGAAQETRLWIVDLEDGVFLRAGSEASGWFSGLLEANTVWVTRGSIRRRYTATPAPEQRSAVNQAMADKYGWRDQYIGTLVGGRDHAMPIQLTPAS